MTQKLKIKCEQKSHQQKKTLPKRAEEIMNLWKIPINLKLKIEAIPESPPWEQVNTNIITNLIEETSKQYPTEQLRDIALKTINKR